MLIAFGETSLWLMSAWVSYMSACDTARNNSETAAGHEFIADIAVYKI